MKIYARQIAPEYQESIFLDDDYYSEIICDGNRNYKSRTIPEYDMFLRNVDDAYNELEDIENQNSSYKNITELVNDMFQRTDKKQYTSKQIHEWKDVIKNYQECKRNEEDKFVCKALELMTGKEYDCTTIKGCCQSDWQNIFYPKEIKNSIRNFEMDYFNLGTEWIIHDKEYEPATPNEISGCSIYCYEYGDKLKEEIASYAGVNSEDVVLYEFDGWSKTENYKIL